MLKNVALLARSAPFLAIAAAALLAGAVGLIGFRKKPQIPEKNRESTAVAAFSTVAVGVRVQPPARSARAIAPLPPVLASSANDVPALDERTLMTTLRELRGSDPNLTLKLARDGNQRFPESADVAERSWVIVKSLSDLGRHDEARAEGRVLVERYRDTRWGEDVYRHLFVNPPTHPFERGYGKVLEGD